MQARFLLGPAGSGKTFRCLAEIRAALARLPEGPPLILLAPKQATFQLERQLLAEDSPTGYTRLHIFSFERLAQFALDQLGVPPPKFLSDEGRVMVLRALLMRHAEELKPFRQSARRPGFARELGRLLNELQQHQLTAARLRAVAGRTDLPPELRNKLTDLALLSERYAGWLQTHELQDANHLLDFATASLRDQVKIENSKLRIEGVWLDGFAEMTPQELDLLAAALPFCSRATLAFCLDKSAVKAEENSWLSLWSAIGKTFQRCRQRLEHLPDCKIQVETLQIEAGKNRYANCQALRHLEKSWSGSAAAFELPSPSPIRIAECPNPGAEAAFAAREILKFVRDGNRFRDCAVIIRTLDAYHQPLERAFRRYEIPFFLDRRESIAHHPLAELTRSALRTVASDWAQADWFAALKSGFAPVAELEIDRLENTALEFGWRGKKWREPLPDEASERLRQIIVPPYEKLFAELIKANFQPTGIQLGQALRDLWRGLRVEKVLEQWAQGDEKSAIHATAWEQMNSWLENVELAFSGERLALREWLPILEAGLANLTVGVIPPSLDEVLIGAIDRARNPDLKLVLLLGMNETVFPAVPTLSPILTDADRDELDHSVALGPDLREQLARERFYAYIACTRGSERLTTTYSRQSADGRSLNPSPFISHFKQVFSGLAEESFSADVTLDNVEHASEAAPKLLEIQYSKDRQQLNKLPALAELIKSLAALHEPDPAENLPPTLAEKLYGPVLRSSVSRLEEFAACPFRFFIRSGLRADERKIFELDARERGNFQHEVLRLFHEQLQTENKRWRDLMPAEARELIGAIATARMESFRDGLFRDSAETVFAARSLATALQDFIEVIVGWMRGQYEFDPVAAELGFGGREDRAPTWEIDLDGGRKLALQGRIDRVDLWRDKKCGEALAVVTDYKSGGKKLDSLLVKNGIQLQLLAYLGALRHWKNPDDFFAAETIVPVGAFYVNLRGEYKSAGSRTEILAEANESRRRAYRHTGRFDASALVHLDKSRAADQFNYRVKTNGELYAGSTEALTRKEFKALIDGVEAQLRAMGKSIFGGTAKVDPYRKGRETPCEICDYQSVCRIDKWTHSYRLLRSTERETLSDTPAPS